MQRIRTQQLCAMIIILLLPVVTDAANVERGPQPGQIVIDPDHPQWLKRQGGEHLFICGPGDPEDFLYRGTRNPDGTRDGDQVDLIRKLIRYGGNCIYMQIVRSHGGDGAADHNPFVESDPAQGLSEPILAQWEEWFRLMDANEILIYLFFYDDGARIWGHKGQEEPLVSPAERAFIEEIVERFQHHRNLIWLVAEESEEASSHARVREIARVIQQADRFDHIIGNHHTSRTTFQAWQPGSALTHFAMQFTAAGHEAHLGAVEALRQSSGKYQIIYSESTAAEPDIWHAWRSAMGGLMPMMLSMDIASTPPETLTQCRMLQRFFEQTDFYEMVPYDSLASAGTLYLLANPGRSYILYAEEDKGPLGIRSLSAGEYALTWLDCQTGTTVERDSIDVPGGDHAFPRPEGIGEQCALYLERHSSGASHR